MWGLSTSLCSHNFKFVFLVLHVFLLLHICRFGNMKYCIHLLNSGWHCYHVASATKQILKDRDRLLHRFEMTLNCQTLQDSIKLMKDIE